MKNWFSYIVGIVIIMISQSVDSAEWPQWRGPNRDGVWPETGVMQEFKTPKLPQLWSVPVASGYSGPTVAYDCVYVMDRITQPGEMERVHCFDRKNGKEIWTHKYSTRYRISYDLGPRTSVTLVDGRAFSLGAMGMFHCLNAKTGEVIWSKDLAAEYEINMPPWGMACSPLVVGENVILQIGGSNGACVVALDTKTGKARWKALEDPPSYSSPILIQQAGKDVAVCWTGANLVGLDPQNGTVYWTYPTKPSQMIHNICTPVFSRDRLFVTSFFDGSLMFKLDMKKPAIENIWQRKGKNERNTQALHSTISTPIVDGDFIYGIDSYGEFRCLNAATGERIWEENRIVPQGRWATIHMVRNGDRTWIYTENGELIICRLTPEGYQEISRAQLIEPTTKQDQRSHPIDWSHPAFAYKHIFARSDRELVCVNLSAE